MRGETNGGIDTSFPLKRSPGEISGSGGPNRCQLRWSVGARTAPILNRQRRALGLTRGALGSTETHTVFPVKRGVRPLPPGRSNGEGRLRRLPVPVPRLRFAHLVSGESQRLSLRWSRPRSTSQRTLWESHRVSGERGTESPDRRGIAGKGRTWREGRECDIDADTAFPVKSGVLPP